MLRLMSVDESAHPHAVNQVQVRGEGLTQAARAAHHCDSLHHVSLPGAPCNLVATQHTPRRVDPEVPRRGVTQFLAAPRTRSAAAAVAAIGERWATRAQIADFVSQLSL